MAELDERENYDGIEDGFDEIEDDDVTDYEMTKIRPSERFVRINEDVVVDVLTGNQYIPAR